MESAYRAHGGLAGGDELASIMRNLCAQPLSQVAHWIVSRAVVQFD